MSLTQSLPKPHGETLATVLAADTSYAAMEQPKKPPQQQQPTAAAPRQSSSSAPAGKKKIPTTLLDAYEVECIRRELERLILKQHAAGVGCADSKVSAEADDDDDAKSEDRRRRHHHHHNHHHRSSKPTYVKNASPAPAAAPNKKVSSGGGAQLLGRHAIAVCGGSVPVSTASDRKATNAKNANHASAQPPPSPAKKVSSGGGVRLLGRHAVAVCGVPVSAAAAGGGRRRRRGSGYREVEVV